MKHGIKMFLIILIAGLLLTSCQGDMTRSEEVTDTNDVMSEINADTDTSVEEVQYEEDDLPSDLDYGGISVSILGWEGAANNEFFADEDGDIVHDAIHSRNRTVEERLNIVLTYSLLPGSYDYRNSFVKTVSSSIMANDGAYDIVAGYSMCGASLAYNRLLIDLTQTDYLNFSKPWWPNSLIGEATCDGKLYFCSGDISTNMIDYLYATFFNKKLLRDSNLEEPYQLVRAGTWTLGKVQEMSVAAGADINGNSKKDPEDSFGYVTHTTWSDSFFFACGLRTTEIGPDRLPILSPKFGGEKAQELLSRLIDWFAGDTAYLATDYDIARNCFLEERALFMTTETYFAGTYLRYSELEYGVIPVPKYDEMQEEYYTVSSFPYSLYGIPVDAKDYSMSSAVLECLASESYRKVSPALFETALKVKYANDDDASEMYDIIRSSNVFDFGRIFNDSMNSMTYSLYRSALANQNKNWISTYKSNETAMIKSLERVVTALTENE